VKVAVVTPSRGLIHSRTVEAIRKNFLGIEKNFEWNHFISHDKPIPKAQNYLFEKAFDWGANYIWSVEEDNVFPAHTLIKMINFAKQKEAEVVYVDYPIGAKRSSGICRKGNQILWGPMGCTLILRSALEKLDRPWFRTDKTFRIENKDPLELIEEDIPNKYGGQDIWFGMKCKEKGIKVVQLTSILAGHVKPKGENREINNTYEFEIWDSIKEHQRYN